MLRLILIVVFLVVTIVVPLLICGETLEQDFSLSGVVTWLEAQGRFAWLATIADLTLPIPASAVMGALGQIYGALVGGLISAVGVVSAGMVGYGLCHWLGRPLTQWLVGAGPLAQGKALFARGGGWVAALSRRVPVLAEMIVCLAGLTRMPFARFALALVCGVLPLGFVYATIGASGADRPALAIGLCNVLPALLWLLARMVLRQPLLGAPTK